MKEGEHVAVYEDPLTEKKFEGTVKLLAKIDETTGHQSKLEHWKVKFIEDGYVTTRVIKVPEQSELHQKVIRDEAEFGV